MTADRPDQDTTSSDEDAQPVSSEGEGSTDGLSNPDLHGAAREVAEKATGEDGPPLTPGG